MKERLLSENPGLNEEEIENKILDKLIHRSIVSKRGAPKQQDKQYVTQLPKESEIKSKKKYQSEYLAKDSEMGNRSLIVKKDQDGRKQSNNWKSEIYKSYIKEKYFEYNYRWVIFSIYVIACLAQSLPLNAFTPIGPEIEKIYKVSTTMVALPSLLALFVSPIAMFPVNFFCNKYGIKKGINIGCVMMIVGTGTKVLVNQSYYFSLVGNTIIGIGNSFVASCPQKVASNWFKPQTRPVISILFTLGIMLSPTFGVILPPLFVGKRGTKTDVFNLMLGQFIFVTLIMIIMLIFFKEKPPSPPSYSAEKPAMDFTAQLKQLFRNKRYYMFMAFIAFGGLGGVTTVLSFYIKPYGHESSEVSLFVLASMLLGLVTSFLSSAYVKRTKKLKFTMIVSQTCVCLAFLGIFLCLIWDGPIWLLTGLAGLYGAAHTPGTPAAFELASEVCYPVAEYCITGFLFGSYEIFQFLLGLAASAIVDGKSKSSSAYGFIMFEIVYIACLVTAFLVKEDFRRTREEIKKTIKIDKNITELNDDDMDNLQDQLKNTGIV